MTATESKGLCDAVCSLGSHGHAYENKFGEAIIVSSDGDYAGLVKFLKKARKIKDNIVTARRRARQRAVLARPGRTTKPTSSACCRCCPRCWPNCARSRDRGRWGMASDRGTPAAGPDDARGGAGPWAPAPEAASSWTSSPPSRRRSPRRRAPRRDGARTRAVGHPQRRRRRAHVGPGHDHRHQATRSPSL